MVGIRQLQPFPVKGALRTGCLVLFLACSTIWTPAEAQSPSFSCAAAESEVEKLICSNSNLAKLDRELSLAYQKINPRPRDDQREWIRKRSFCYSAECLTRLYTTRLASFTALQDFDPANQELRQTAQELLESSLTCKPKVEHGRFDDTITTFVVGGTLETLELTIKIESVWTKGSAVGDHSDTGSRETFVYSYKAAYSDLLLAIHEEDGPLQLACRDQKRCIMVKEVAQPEWFVRFKACDETSTADARDAFNYLVLFARK